MKKLFLFFFISLMIISSIMHSPKIYAKRGDTNSVKLFDKYLWTYYGSQSRWGVFPSADKKFERIMMHFILTCPTGGCGEWDYTMKVMARNHTGKLDSNLVDAPSFTIGGGARDTLKVSSMQTFKTKFNATVKKTDTILNSPITISFYKNNASPFTVSDTQQVYEAEYWNYYYSSTGVKSDSLFVKSDLLFTKGNRKAYKPFEIVLETEIARFITPYGKWFPKDWSYSWDYDITDYAHMLTDSTEIRVIYDGYSQGSLFTLTFDMIEGIPARETYKSQVLWSGNPTYGDPNNPISNFLTPKTMPSLNKEDMVTLRLMTTGHGFGGTENAAEFSEKTHMIAINGQDLYEQHLWRPDCGQNPVYPQAGTWYFQRGGWCPGDAVQYWDYNITEHFSKSDSVQIDYNMVEYTNDDLGKRASYILEGQILYSKANYINNASLEEIKTPNNAYKYRRMNPICRGQQPLIVVKNNGKSDLTSLVIRYKVDNEAENVFNWKGTIPYMNTAEILLPALEFPKVGDHKFTVGVYEPNGKADESTIGDMMTVNFTNGKTVNNSKIILTITLDYVQGYNNSIRYQIVDNEGYIIKEKDGFVDKSTIRDTTTLEDGCYRFIIYEEGIGDGLYPIYSGSTRGSFSLKDSKNTMIYNTASSLFGQPAGVYASFGDREIITFQVNTAAASTEEELLSTIVPELRVSPNPLVNGNGFLTVKGLQHSSSVNVKILSPLGRELYSQIITAGEAEHFPLDLHGFASGSYQVQISQGSFVLTESLVHLAQ